MTALEFRESLGQNSDQELLGLCLRDDITPYVFESKPEMWSLFKNQLALRLGTSADSIRVIGSGRLGFSLKPGNNLREFQDTSDIDVIVISPDLFDELWQRLLEAAYPRPPMLQRLGGWIAARRNEVYTGWISPLEISLDSKIVGPKAKPVLQLRLQWFNALKEASQYPPMRHEDISGRLYRTSSHADLYHLDSLAALRRSLLN